jgi:predicted Zn finger-like uncharacterized protein
MTVHCPHCSTGYRLPGHLMGPLGARVRCPECQGSFEVSREAPNGEEDSRLAGELLSALAERLGDSLDQARAQGRVLARFGPEVMDAFDEYRARLGERAAPAAFRAALKDGWGIDLGA